MRLVPVTTGDRVVNARGDAGHTLAPGEQLLTAGGAVETFDDAALVMEQQVVDFVIKPRTWSDGKPVTADDSVYSFELAADPATPGDKWVIDRTASYLATGTMRTRWTGLPGFRDANFTTNFWPPAPRHIWRDLSAVDLLSAPASARMPIGDGPFQLVSWEPGAQMRLERNPFYFRASEGFPRLDAVLFRFEPDVNARLSGLLDGTCDIVPRDGLTSDLLPFFAEAAADGLLRPVVRAGPQRRTLLLSAGDGTTGPGQAGPFADAGLRRATALCLDRAGLVARVAHGRSAVSSSYVPAEHPLFAADVARWPYDPLAANRMLDELGYADSDGDGLRDQPATGLPLQLTLLAQRDPITRDVAEQIAHDLRACGLSLTLDLRDDFDPDALDGRPFDLALTSKPAPLIPDCERYASWQTGAGRREDPPPGLAYTGTASPNLGGWSDPAFDTACAAALRALPGTTAAQDGHEEAQRLFAATLAAIPFYPGANHHCRPAGRAPSHQRSVGLHRPVEPVRH